MSLNVPVFYTRTISAIFFAAIMLCGLLLPIWAFVVLVMVIQALCLHEYFKLMHRIAPDDYCPPGLPYGVQAFAALTTLLTVAFTDNVLLNLWHKIELGQYLGLFLVLPALAMVVALLSKQLFFRSWLNSIAGILYINLPIIFLVILRRNDPLFPLYFIVLIWINDTMAYIVGSFIGKTPFSSISPKKTWEGTVGGALLTIVAGVVYGYFSHTYRLGDWAALAAIVAFTGTLGDLMESKLKRLADVKDSGNMMPGHGGALDRFDSLLIATPFVFVYAIIVMK